MRRNRRQNTVSTPSPNGALAGVYIMDPAHSTVGFSIRHAVMSSVRGQFDSFEGFLTFDEAQPTRSGAYLSIRTDSLNTGMRERDAHLTGPGVFDCSTFPLMTFRSTGLAPAGDGWFHMSGNLRIKDVELPLVVDLAYAGAARGVRGQHRVGFEGAATLQRSDWGLTWPGGPESGSVLVRDTVKLMFAISAVQVTQEVTA
ncbi:YceI family protein [Streptomyces sp. NPDC086077]|uniref:YceI family protein n=1 Tax=Streptomyces sp. NPDC086077 TaxID=3154862 RepID=UPI00343F4859